MKGYVKILVGLLLVIVSCRDSLAGTIFVDSLMSRVSRVPYEEKGALYEKIVDYYTFVNKDSACKYLSILKNKRPEKNDTTQNDYVYLEAGILWYNNAFQEAYELLEEYYFQINFDSLHIFDLELIDMLLRMKIEINSAFKYDSSELCAQFEKYNSHKNNNINCILIEANVYRIRKQYGIMQKLLARAKEIPNSQSNAHIIVRIDNLLGESFINQLQYDSAIRVLKGVLSKPVLVEELKKTELREVYRNLSVAYDSLKSYNEALNYINKAIKYSERYKNKKELELKRGELLFKSKKYSQAKKKLIDLLNECAEVSLPKLKREANIILNEIYRLEHDYKKLFETAITIDEYESLLHNQIKIKNEAYLKIKYKVKEKLIETDLIKKENEINKARYTEQNFFMLVLVIVILLLFIVLYFFHRRYLVKYKLNISIQEQAKLIQDQEKSIENYSAKIKMQSQHIENQFSELEKTSAELQKLMSIIDQGNNAIMVINAQGKIEWVNKGFRKMFGYTLAEYVKEKGTSIYNASGNKEIRKDIAYCISNKQSVIYYSINTTKKGETKWIQTMITPIFEDNGAIDKLIAVDSDYTQFRQTEDLLSKTNNNWLGRKRILDNMNSEIILPVNAIIDHSLNAKPLLSSSDEKRYINTIIHNGNALKKIIGNMIDYSKIETKKLKVQISTVNIKQLVKEVSIPFEKDIREKDLSFAVDIDGEVAEYYEMDNGNVKKLLLNLLSNAFKFTNVGYVKLKIYPSNIKGEKRLSFKIEDSGIGMALSGEHKFYDTHVQTDHQNDKYGGVGLGLLISKGIVNALKGIIEIESERNKGTSVLVNIPVLESSQVDMQTEENIKEEAINYDLQTDEDIHLFNIESVISQMAKLPEETIGVFKREEFEKTKELYINANKTRSINEIKRFIYKLQFISQKYELGRLYDYQQILEAAMFAFEIKSIVKMLDDFQEVIDLLEN